MNMNRKTLYIIIVALAVILVTGVVLVFTMPAPVNNTQDDSLTDVSANTAETETIDSNVQIIDETNPWDSQDDSVSNTQSEDGLDDSDKPVVNPPEEATVVLTPTEGKEDGKQSGSQNDKEPTGTVGSQTEKDPTDKQPGGTTEGTASQDQPTAPTYVQPTTPEGDPIDDATVPNVPDVTVPESDQMTYETYANMSAEEQMAFFDSFESVDAFFDWYNAARKEYEDSFIEIDGSTPIDLDEILGGN